MCIGLDHEEMLAENYSTNNKKIGRKKKVCRLDESKVPATLFQVSVKSREDLLDIQTGRRFGPNVLLVFDLHFNKGVEIRRAESDELVNVQRACEMVSNLKLMVLLDSLSRIKTWPSFPRSRRSIVVLMFTRGSLTKNPSWNPWRIFVLSNVLKCERARKKLDG